MTDPHNDTVSLHRQVQAYLERLAALNFGELHTFPPEQVREGLRMQIPLLGEPEAVAAIDNRMIPGPNGPVPVRIYTPEGGEQFGHRLEEAGVPTTISRYQGMIHEFVRHSFDDSARARLEAGT